MVRRSATSQSPASQQAPAKAGSVETLGDARKLEEPLQRRCMIRIDAVQHRLKLNHADPVSPARPARVLGEQTMSRAPKASCCVPAGALLFLWYGHTR